VSSLTLLTEQDEQLDWLAVGGRRGMRSTGVEFRGLARTQLEIVIAEKEPESAVLISS
jgi:hypothetical protein